MKLSNPSSRKRVANRYIECGKDIQQVAEEFGLTIGQVRSALNSPEGKEIAGEQDALLTAFAAFTEFEYAQEMLDAIKMFKGEKPVKIVVPDRDGGVNVHEECKFHPADYRAALADVGKYMGYGKTVDVNVHHKVVQFDMTGIDEEPAGFPAEEDYPEAVVETLLQPSLLDETP